MRLKQNASMLKEGKLLIATLSSENIFNIGIFSLNFTSTRYHPSQQKNIALTFFSLPSLNMHKGWQGFILMVAFSMHCWWWWCNIDRLSISHIWGGERRKKCFNTNIRAFIQFWSSSKFFCCCWVSVVHLLSFLKIQIPLLFLSKKFYSLVGDA